MVARHYSISRIFTMFQREKREVKRQKSKCKEISCRVGPFCKSS